MPDRIRSDNPGLTTVDATLERRGATDRPAVAVPAGDADLDLPAEGVVRLLLDGTEYHAPATRPLTGDPGARLLTGAYDAPGTARDPGDDPNRLAEWVADRGLDAGRTVHLDVVAPGHAYGLRAPGETATYDAVDRPDEDLAAIAEGLDESE